MNEADREEIDRLKTELEKSGVDPVSRLRGHRALVLSANAANGCKTVDERSQRMAEAMHALSVFMVGFVAGAPASTETAARKAVSDCPMRAVHASPADASGKPADADLVTRPWDQVAKAAFLRSPMALAIVLVALILRGLGPLLLKAAGIG